MLLFIWFTCCLLACLHACLPACLPACRLPACLPAWLSTRIHTHIHTYTVTYTRRQNSYIILQTSNHPSMHGDNFNIISKLQEMSMLNSMPKSVGRRLGSWCSWIKEISMRILCFWCRPYDMWAFGFDVCRGCTFLCLVVPRGSVYDIPKRPSLFSFGTKFRNGSVSIYKQKYL